MEELPLYKPPEASDCGCSEAPESACDRNSENVDDEVCCGAPPSPRSSEFDRPGYVLWPFVETFINTPVGPVPKVKTTLGKTDLLGTARARSGLWRDDYKISPGIYAVGNPDADAPVLVSANYKLSFDTVRKALTGQNLWILVIDTRSINVWCAAGKALFGTDEVAHQVKRVGLEKLLSHRRLILPQLCATGVDARKVKKACGFKVIWGPIRANDIPAFLQNNHKTSPDMRKVTFTLPERTTLIPVELSAIGKPVLWFFLAAYILSGFQGGVFSFSEAWHRAWIVMAAGFAGIFSGAVLVPALLPWIPGRAFAFKGLVTGMVMGLLVMLTCGSGGVPLEKAALWLLTVAVSSYLAMNFTGSTPYTSPSGVETEMRRAIPIQAGMLLLAAVLWFGVGIFG